jgi:hypothetical protein
VLCVIYRYWLLKGIKKEMHVTFDTASTGYVILCFIVYEVYTSHQKESLPYLFKQDADIVSSKELKRQWWIKRSSSPHTAHRQPVVE